VVLPEDLVKDNFTISESDGLEGRYIEICRLGIVEPYKREIQAKCLIQDIY
jgi:hypothetical protein